MGRIIAFGNNVCGNLDPNDSASISIIDEPKDVTLSVGCNDILWSGWSNTVGHSNAVFSVWGTESPKPLVTILGSLSDLKVLGSDIPLAVIRDGTLYPLDSAATIDVSTYQQVEMYSGGIIASLRSPTRLLAFPSLESFRRDVETIEIAHPYINAQTILKVHTTENKAFIHTSDFAHHLFTVDDGKLQLYEDLEGLNVSQVITGPNNRIGVITDGGDVYLLGGRDKTFELLDFDKEVQLLGLGSDFDIVVDTDGMLWIRGKSIPGPDTEDWIQHPYFIDKKIVKVLCARWSTFVVIQDESG